MRRALLSTGVALRSCTVLQTRPLRTRSAALHKKADGSTIPQLLRADVFKHMPYWSIGTKLIAFVADLLAAFQETGATFSDNGSRRFAAGKLAGYLKKILEGSEEEPDFSGDTADDSEKILDYLMDLPSSNLEILWRRAKRYNDVAEWQLEAVDDMELG